MIDVLQRLYAHLRWADERALEALRAAPGTQAAPALQLLGHILGAEQVWLARLNRRPATVAVWPELALDECVELAAATHRELEALLTVLSDADLRRDVPYTNSAGQHFRSTRLDILLHVALHGTYHRGQVAQLIRQGGGTPAPTDYIAFVRGTPAATRGSTPRRE